MKYGELPMRAWTLAVVFLLSPGAVAQKSPAVLQGEWTATAGAKMFRGTWTGQVLSRRSDAGRGSWTLVGETGITLMRGTWSAEKRASGWQGTWSARTAQGRSYSGSWSANMADSTAKTFGEMLKAALEKEIAGFWQSGGSAGDWWLRGLPAKSRPD